MRPVCGQGVGIKESSMPVAHQKASGCVSKCSCDRGSAMKLPHKIVMNGTQNFVAHAKLRYCWNSVQIADEVNVVLSVASHLLRLNIAIHGP